MKRTIVFLLSLCIVLFFCINLMAETPAAKQPPIVLKGGIVWDGVADQPLGVQDILIRDGKIVEIGKTITIPKGAQIINLSNHTITPGFIDTHVHMDADPDNLLASGLTLSGTRHALKATKNLKILLMNGFTSIRDVASFTPEYNTIDLRNAINAGEVIGPRMFVAPHFITATGAHGDLTGFLSPEYGWSLKSRALADGPEEIRRVVREEVRAGADWIKFGASGGFVSPSDDPKNPTYSQEEMNILVKTAHDLGIPVSVHVYGGEALKRAIEAGVDSVEHGSLASPELLALTRQKGIYIVPTQFTFEDSLNNPKYWETHSKAEYEKTVKYTPALLSCMKNLADSDIKVVFGTDVGLFSFNDNWKEFPTMVKNGIAPVRALKAATSTAAEMLRRPDLGVLAPGKTADIIAMPDNPFTDINVTGKVDFVMKDGVIYKQK
jgi:imidazolonepropionase-like amidohydrolase